MKDSSDNPTILPHPSFLYLSSLILAAQDLNIIFGGKVKVCFFINFGHSMEKIKAASGNCLLGCCNRAITINKQFGGFGETDSLYEIRMKGI